MYKQSYKIGKISLGCPKNQVDAEQMLGVLSGSGFESTSEQSEADVIVVNTCGFIESAKELILLAQDSTAYRDGEIDLPALLKSLATVHGIERLRLMYAYPGRISDALMTVMAEEEKICKYLDIPVQHIDDKILKAMNRRASSDDVKRTIDKLRKRVPGIALRTSLIVGFPGETEAGPGEFVNVTIIGATEYDLMGKGLAGKNN